MNLLIITQKVDVNDDNLGFFHAWLEKFSLKASYLIVIGQYKRVYNLPFNVKVFSLGKEKNYSKFRQLFNFYILLFKNLSKVDAVFVHMIPMWAVLCYPLSFFFRKKVYLWYVHKSINFWLKISEKLVFKIFTASKESFRLPSKKVIITGHGIDIERFKIRPQEFYELKPRITKLKIIHAGRIAPVKNQEILIKAADILVNQKKIKNFQIQIIGRPILKPDFKYLENLKKFVSEKKLENFVKFLGKVSHQKIADYYQKADLFFHLSGTGSVDKVALEALACGLSVFSSSEAFQKILPKKYLLQEATAEIIANTIVHFQQIGEKEKQDLRNIVVKKHSLNNLITRILKEIT